MTRLQNAVGLRVFTKLGAVKTARIVALVALASTMVWVVVNAQPWSGPPVSWIPDTVSYYDGAERLNAGHNLYRLSPGDRPIHEDPFTFAGPFLYPPLVAVAWRPIAAVAPYETAVTTFWAMGLVVLLGSCVWLVLRGGVVTSVGVTVLAIPLSLTAWSGNISTLLTPMIVASWLLLLRRRDRLSASLIALGAVVKLTPMFLGWWLVVMRRWSGVKALIVLGFTFAVIGIAGTDLASLPEYPRITAQIAREAGTPVSLHSVVASLGGGSDVRALIAPAVALTGVIAVALLRRHPRAAWAAAIVTGVYASPIVNLTNVSLLLAAFVALDAAFGPIPSDWYAIAGDTGTDPGTDAARPSATLSP